MEKQLWTVHDVSEYLDLAPITIYKYVSHRKIPFVKIGSRVRFHKKRIDDWLDGKEQLPLQG